MDLNTVKASLDGRGRRIRIIPNKLLNLVLGERSRHRRLSGDGDIAGADDVEAVSREEFRRGSAAETPQLAEDDAAAFVHGGGDVLPRGDHVGRVNAGDVGVARGLRRDEGCFRDEEGAGDGGALGVVFLDEGELDVVVVWLRWVSLRFEMVRGRMELRPAYQRESESTVPLPRDA